MSNFPVVYCPECKIDVWSNPATHIRHTMQTVYTNGRPPESKYSVLCDCGAILRVTLTGYELAELGVDPRVFQKSP